MKYMGSKRAMLKNGLGDLLAKELRTATRFVDIFSGSASVAAHVAQENEVPVLAFDLQSYSAILARAVVARRCELSWGSLWSVWFAGAKVVADKHSYVESKRLTQAAVAEARRWSAAKEDLPITRSYGGHYFSPTQAVWIDSLLTALPAKEPDRTVALAALIHAASYSAAAPGHTAQPFQPTRTAKKYLADAWRRDVLSATRNALQALATTYAKSNGGSAEVKDANEAAKQLMPGDLVFIDPPYSGVHYSRFYHVLETIARGSCGEVSGVGRYPSPAERPISSYSIATKAPKALDDLLKTIAGKGARAILTFPDHHCSNGLSGSSVRTIAAKYFKIEVDHVKSLFSTMGGTGDKKRKGEAKRQARHVAKELMLVLEPR